MLNSKLDIIKETLKDSALDRTFFEIVSEMTAEEWGYALSNIEHFDGLLPYLIYTYNSGKIDEIAEKFSDELVGRSLTCAWFDVINNRQENIDDQPTLIELGKKPCLKAVFDGHLIQKIERANYEEDISGFIRLKFKQLVDDFIGFAKKSPNEAGLVLVGCVEANNSYPAYHDHDESEIHEVIEFASLISAIGKMCELLCIDENPSEKIEELLMAGEYISLIDAAQISETQKRRNKCDTIEVERYIISVIEKHVDRFTPYMCTQSELTYMRSLYSRGLVKFSENNIEQDPAVDDDYIKLDIAEIPLGEPVVSKGKVAKVKTEWQKRVQTTISNLFKKEKENSSLNSSSKEKCEQEANFDELVFTSKKKGRTGYTWIILLIIAICTWMTFIQNNESKNETSIIEQTSGNHKEEKTEFSVVKVYE